MKMRTVITALLATAFLFVAGTSQARWLNPNTGRFQTMDSYDGDLEDPPSLHKYTYAANDPVNNRDPSGQFTVAEVTFVADWQIRARTQDAARNAPYANAARVAGQFQRALVRAPGPPTVLNPAPYAPQIANSAIARGFAYTLLGIIAAGQTAQILDAVIADDTISDRPDDAFVVRGGVASPQNLQENVRRSQAAGFPVTGFSVQSEPGKTVDELALAGRFRNNQISVTTVNTIRAAGFAAGYGVDVVKTPGAGYHRTVTTPAPLPDPLAQVLSRTFIQMPNPHPFR